MNPRVLNKKESVKNKKNPENINIGQTIILNIIAKGKLTFWKFGILSYSRPVMSL